MQNHLRMQNSFSLDLAGIDLIRAPRAAVSRDSQRTTETART